MRQGNNGTSDDSNGARNGGRPPNTRTDLVGLNLTVPFAFRHKLKSFAAELDQTMTEIVLEGVELVFERRANKPEPSPDKYIAIC